MKLLLMLILALLPLKGQVATENDITCLAKNIYHEARGESSKGKMAVALVTLNRAKDSRFPSTVCGVVYQKNQFSWTRKFKRSKVDQKAWDTALSVAINAYLNEHNLGAFRATHFHNKSVRPGWKLTYITTIGNHRFYS